MTTENLMEILEALDRKVEELLGTIGELKIERDLLQEELNEAKQKQEELTVQVNSGAEKRTEIRDRIQAIIQKIEKLES